MSDTHVPSRLTERLHPLAIIPCIFIIVIGAVGGSILAAGGWKSSIDMRSATTDDYFDAKWYGLTLYRSKSAESMLNFATVAWRVSVVIGTVLGTAFSGAMILLVGRPVRRAWGAAAHLLRKIT